MDLQNALEQIEQQNRRLKRALWTTGVMAIVLLSLLAAVVVVEYVTLTRYGVEVDLQRRLAEQMRVEAQHQRAIAEQRRAEAERQRDIALRERHEAERQRKIAEQALQEAVLQRDLANRQRALAEEPPRGVGSEENRAGKTAVDVSSNDEAGR